MWESVIILAILSLAILYIVWRTYRSVKDKNSGMCPMCVLKDKCQRNSEEGGDDI